MDAERRSSGPGTATYADLSRQAAAAGLRLWDTHGCGDGPSPDAPLTMRVNYDAKCNDRFNVNGEWAEIHNDSGPPSRSRAGGSATRRCAATRSRRAPSSRPAAPSGSAWATAPTRADELHWGLDSPPFENPSYDERATGDGGYLFDPRGNLRAWVIYN